MVALFRKFYKLHRSGHTTDLQLKFDHLYSFKEGCLNILQAVAFVRLSKTTPWFTFHNPNEL